MIQTKTLPDFLILGAPKAGTTALFRALSKHPKIYGSANKEPRFFAYPEARPTFSCPGGADSARQIVSGKADYFALFANCPPGALAGEASTLYLSASKAPQNAFSYVPQARLVAVLRHPVERAYSQWLHLRQEGYEPEADFAAALELWPKRRAQGWRPAYDYRGRGFYGAQLDRWLRYFGRDQLLILFYEDWRDRPAQTLELICQHLSVEPFVDPVITKENVSSRQPRWLWLNQRMVEHNALRAWAQRRLPLRVRDLLTHFIQALNLVPGPKLDPGLRARLANDFDADLKRVEELSGRDLSAWRR